MRIAACLTGQLRTGLCPAPELGNALTSLESFYENVLRRLHQPDVFVVLDDAMHPESLGQVRNLLKPVMLHLESERNVSSAWRKTLHHINQSGAPDPQCARSAWPTRNGFAQAHRLQICWRAVVTRERGMGRAYDYVLRSRPDLLFSAPLALIGLIHFQDRATAQPTMRCVQRVRNNLLCRDRSQSCTNGPFGLLTSAGIMNNILYDGFYLAARWLAPPLFDPLELALCTNLRCANAAAGCRSNVSECMPPQHRDLPLATVADGRAVPVGNEGLHALALGQYLSTNNDSSLRIRYLNRNESATTFSFAPGKWPASCALDEHAYPCTKPRCATMSVSG